MVKLHDSIHITTSERLRALEQRLDMLEAQEEERATAEQRRDAAEGERQSREQIRQAMEVARQHEEQFRQGMEKTRQHAERLRQQNEQLRQEAVKACQDALETVLEVRRQRAARA